MKTITILTATDLHQREVLYDDLAAAVERHQPDVVALAGDFLCQWWDSIDGKIPVAECAERLHALPCPEVIFTRGNHEGENWLEFQSVWQAQPNARPLHALHAEAWQHGPLTIIGFPCLLGDEMAYVGEREAAFGDVSDWLQPTLPRVGRSSRTLWLMHEPPAETVVTRGLGREAGVSEWRSAIEDYQPWLVVSGHLHESAVETGKWHDRMGRTLCINAGQVLTGPLRYVVMEFTFRDETPGLPVEVKVFRHTGDCLGGGQDQVRLPATKQKTP